MKLHYTIKAEEQARQDKIAKQKATMETYRERVKSMIEIAQSMWHNRIYLGENPINMFRNRIHYPHMAFTTLISNHCGCHTGVGFIVDDAKRFDNSIGDASACLPIGIGIDRYNRIDIVAVPMHGDIRLSRYPRDQDQFFAQFDAFEAKFYAFVDSQIAIINNLSCIVNSKLS